MKYFGKIQDNKDLVTKEYVDTGLSGKQDTLTFDTTPTANSTNPVTSGGIKSALTNLIKTKTEDATIDENGYFTTTLPTASAAIIAVTYFKYGNFLPKPYRYEILNYGGDNVDVTALRFLEWDGTILGKNSAARVTYKYIDL